MSLGPAEILIIIMYWAIPIAVIVLVVCLVVKAIKHQKLIEESLAQTNEELHELSEQIRGLREKR